MVTNLRICDNGRERITSASLDLVEQTFAPEAPVSDGLEVSLADGDRWLAAIAVGAPGTSGEFLISGHQAAISGTVSRSEALSRFREFLEPERQGPG
jgi:hypothetical protein